eukprot:14757310-Ditylum_brightwellii.AAC.1
MSDRLWVPWVVRELALTGARYVRPSLVRVEGKLLVRGSRFSSVSGSSESGPKSDEAIPPSSF